MKDSLEQIFTNFQQKCMNLLFCSEDTFDLSEVIQEYSNLSNDLAKALIKIKLEAIDDALLNSQRIKQTYKVEHRKRPRTIQSKIGTITYQRSYFKHRKTQKYSYIVDDYASINKNQRLTDDLIVSLANAAVSMPYRKASEIITGNEISPQTVMNAIRKTEPVCNQIIEKKKVKLLHLDVDEDHIAVVENHKVKTDIVRLAVSYEGIKDGKCINPIAIGRYEKDVDEYWDTVLYELYKRYDLTEATVYLHADGASWINKARNYFPKTKFVLDKFHKNKYITQIFSCVNDEIDHDLEKHFRQALNERKSDVVIALYEYIQQKYTNTISLTAGNAVNYLLKNIEGIAICKEDEEANNGGCSEQHVSNYLSNRLSSRPRVWSKKTLETLVPMLTARTSIKVKEKPRTISKTVTRIAKRQSEKMLYSFNPDSIGNIPALAYGKVNPLYNSLCWINN